MARKLKYNDEEGGMAKAQLQKIEMYAAKLNEMIHPEDELEGWVQNKLSVVAAYMGDVKHYLDYALQNEPEYKEFANGGMMDKPRYWEVEFTWDAADEESRKVNVMAESVSDAEEQVKKKFGPYYEGLKVVEVEEDKEITWDEYEKRPKKYETRSYSKEEMDEITRAQIKHDEEQLRREQGFADGGMVDNYSTWNFWKNEYENYIEELKENIKADYDDDEVSFLTKQQEYELESYQHRLEKHLEKGKEKGWYASGGMMAKGGKVEDELYVAEYRKGEWTVKDKKNPSGNYTLSTKKENAESVRKELINKPSLLKYYRKNEYASGGMMKYEGSTEAEDFKEAEEYIGKDVWETLSKEDKLNATQYLKAKGVIGFYGQEEELADFMASQYAKGGSLYRGMRPSPSISATAYPRGFKMIGNDGNMWEISLDSRGVHRWTKSSSATRNDRTEQKAKIREAIELLESMRDEIDVEDEIATLKKLQ